MKRIVFLNIRISSLLDDTINDFCKKLNVTRSDLGYKALMYYLKDRGYIDGGMYAFTGGRLSSEWPSRAIALRQICR